jgi:formylglycine-generating enzyme
MPTKAVGRLIDVLMSRRHWRSMLEIGALLVFVGHTAVAEIPSLRAEAAISAGQSKAVGAPDRVPTRNPQDGLVYVWIPPGSFLMGCSDGDNECFAEENPRHRVTLSHGFWIGQTEVTVAAYEKFAEITTPLVSADGGANLDNMPIADVTWDEAHDYCKWAGGRLPTEAEWEYAARGRNTKARYGDLDAIAWYEKNSRGASHPVAERIGNGFELFDMLGNIWEWVNDWYDGSYYSGSPELDPVGPQSGKMRVLRGGSWLNPEKLARLSDRGRSEPDARFNYFGMRCVWDR